MKQKDKELLVIDLLGRLPYEVIVETYWDFENKNTKTFPKCKLTYKMLEYYLEEQNWNNNTHFLPFLRPMSSMTEEEKEELKEICSIYIPTDSKNIGFEDYGILVFTHHLTDNSYSFKLNLNVIDWLNAHHFDYRGLIEKGLAFEAPEGIYNA